MRKDKIRQGGFLVKRVIALVLFGAVLLAALPAMALDFDCWNLNYLMDDFGDATKYWYLENYAGVLINDRPALGAAAMTVSYQMIGFFLIENINVADGTGKLVTNSTLIEQEYRVSFKDDNGNKYTCTGTQASGEELICVENIRAVMFDDKKLQQHIKNYSAISEMLRNSKEIQIVISSPSGKKYSFTIRGNSSFMDVYPFEDVGSFAQGLAMVSKLGRSGAIDTTGKLVIPCEWNYVGEFSEGLAAVKKNGKYGFIDMKGKLVIPCEWDDVRDFSRGMAKVRKDKKYGFIDTTGKFVIPCEWDYAGGFNEGLAPVKKNDKWGFIDTTGNLVIPCEWDDARGFNEGLARVEKNDKWGFIDTTGYLVIPCEWDDVRDFSEGLAWVKKDTSYMFIDKTGNVVIGN